ncbi:unnamed protein product [Caenorhabditis brenneri]
MDHIPLTEEDKQDPGNRMPSDFSQESPPARFASRQNPPLAINPSAISILLSDFSQYLPQLESVPNSGFQSPGNTTTSDGSEKDFGRQGLMS